MGRFLLPLAAAIFALALASSAVCRASDTVTALYTQLMARTQARLDAIAAGDKGPWKSDLDPHALLIDEEGNVTTTTEFLAALKPLPKGSTGSLRITKPAFTFTGDVAVLSFIADENEDIFAQHFHADFAMTDTYYRNGGKWMLLADTQTRLPQDPPTVTPTLEQMQSVAGDYRMVGGPTIFSVTIVNGALLGGRAGTPPSQMYAIADAPGQYFRKHHPETLIFVPGAAGHATKLIDRRYYNRDMTYELVAK